MPDIDEFSRLLLEESKRFFEKALGKDASETQACLHAALALGYCAFESYVNAVCDDFVISEHLSVLESSILSEKEFKLDKGHFVLTDKLKMYRLEDRIEFLYRRFGGKELDKTSIWWVKLKAAGTLRNELVHPKGVPVFSVAIVKDALEAIIESLDALFQAVYKKGFPPKGRGLDSTLDF